MNLTETDRTAIRSVVEQQLQAFQQDDATKAFSFASPGIRALFGTPETFIKMVRQAYQPVYRPRSVLFESVTILEGTPTQPVLLLGADDTPVRAFYLMELQRDGSWRINGCLLAPIDQ